LKADTGAAREAARMSAKRHSPMRSTTAALKFRRTAVLPHQSISFSAASAVSATPPHRISATPPHRRAGRIKRGPRSFRHTATPHFRHTAASTCRSHQTRPPQFPPHQQLAAPPHRRFRHTAIPLFATPPHHIKRYPANEATLPVEGFDHPVAGRNGLSG
jgi:hypothetical protein